MDNVITQTGLPMADLAAALHSLDPASAARVMSTIGRLSQRLEETEQLHETLQQRSRQLEEDRRSFESYKAGTVQQLSATAYSGIIAGDLQRFRIAYDGENELPVLHPAALEHSLVRYNTDAAPEELALQCAALYRLRDKLVDDYISTQQICESNVARLRKEEEELRLRVEQLRAGASRVTRFDAGNETGITTAAITAPNSDIQHADTNTIIQLSPVVRSMPVEQRAAAETVSPKTSFRAKLSPVDTFTDNIATNNNNTLSSQIDIFEDERSYRDEFSPAHTFQEEDDGFQSAPSHSTPLLHNSSNRNKNNNNNMVSAADFAAIPPYVQHEEQVDEHPEVVSSDRSLASNHHDVAVASKRAIALKESARSPWSKALRKVGIAVALKKFSPKKQQSAHANDEQWAGMYAEGWADATPWEKLSGNVPSPAVSRYPTLPVYPMPMESAYVAPPPESTHAVFQRSNLKYSQSLDKSKMRWVDAGVVVGDESSNFLEHEVASPLKLDASAASSLLSLPNMPGTDAKPHMPTRRASLTGPIEQGRGRRGSLTLSGTVLENSLSFHHSRVVELLKSLIWDDHGSNDQTKLLDNPQQRIMYHRQIKYARNDGAAVLGHAYLLADAILLTDAVTAAGATQRVRHVIWCDTIAVLDGIYPEATALKLRGTLDRALCFTLMAISSSIDRQLIVCQAENSVVHREWLDNIRSAVSAAKTATASIQKLALHDDHSTKYSRPSQHKPTTTGEPRTEAPAPSHHQSEPRVSRSMHEIASRVSKELNFGGSPQAVDHATTPPDLRGAGTAGSGTTPDARLHTVKSAVAAVRSPMAPRMSAAQAILMTSTSPSAHKLIPDAVTLSPSAGNLLSAERPGLKQLHSVARASKAHKMLGLSPDEVESSIPPAVRIADSAPSKARQLLGLSPE